MVLPVKWKILLIDDEEDIREVVGITLEDSGYKVIQAADGHTGLMLATREDPQIVITDIKMPGLDGLQVLEKIKKLKPETEVIVTTGFGDIQKAVTALQYDASDFISKPINDDALHMALKRAKDRFLHRKELADYTMLLEKRNLKTSTDLVKSVEFQSSLIENSMDGILGCNNKDRVITYNLSMEKMLGYPKNKVIGAKKLKDFFKPDILATLKADLSGKKFGGKGRLGFYEATLLSEDGQDIPVQMSGFTLSREKKEDTRVFFVSDLRQVRTLEQEKADQASLLHQEKMISLGRLAASIVHEINNPLSGILNYIRLMLRMVSNRKQDQSAEGLLQKDAASEKFTGYLKIVEKEIQRCSDLVSGLLKFSRKTELEKQPVDLNDLVEHCLLLCSHKLELCGIELKKECPRSLPPVIGDFNQLGQCVINLIFNAVDAMENGGVLDIQTGLDPEKKLVFIAVKDNGCGISRHALNYIFEPFFTTKNEGYGVGLGLSTAYGIIENHRGTITVDSIKDLGSEFIIKLPVQDMKMTAGTGIDNAGG